MLIVGATVAILSPNDGPKKRSGSLRIKYIKGVANLGNDSPLLGIQQNGERSCDGEIKLASNPPRFLIVED